MKSHLPEQEKASGSLNMNLYDLNKQIIAQLPDIDQEEMLSKAHNINSFVHEFGGQYYMLLCKDINYYTLFHLMEDSILATIGVEVVACADYLGKIKSIEREEDSFEIWVQPRKEEAEPVVMYFFPYNEGVVECRV